MNNLDDLLNNSPAKEQPHFTKEDYIAQKQAEREAVFALSDATALNVSGNGDRFQAFLDVQSRFDRYSAVNTLLIFAQKPEATRLRSFDSWKDNGGFIKPGQTGISILEPHEYIKEDGSAGTGYNIKKVFDISQVDTRKMNSPAPVPKYTNRQLLQALISKALVKITGVNELPGELGAQTHPETGEIFVLKGMDFGETFSSVAQELAYSELATSPKTQENPQFSAFCASYLLCKKYGVDTQVFDFSDAPNIFEGMDAQAVKGELSQIRDAASNIAARMARQLDAITKAAKSQEPR